MVCSFPCCYYSHETISFIIVVISKIAVVLDIALRNEVSHSLFEVKVFPLDEEQFSVLNDLPFTLGRTSALLQWSWGSKARRSLLLR